MYTWILGVCVFLILYTYIIYPGILWIFSVFSPDPSYKLPEKLPFVTMLVSVYNEEQIIEKKINNFLTTCYPADKMELIIGDDGSDDHTASILNRLCDGDKIHYIRFDGRHGKAWVLNKIVKKAKGHFLVFSDANTFYDKNAIKALIRKLNKKSTGGVCGRLILNHADDSNDQSGELSYWRYESWVKKLEGRIKTVFGANGAIYAIRKQLFVDLPIKSFLNDDFIIPIHIIMQGFRVDYSDDAFAFENAPKDIKEEFVRKVRIGAGNFNALPIILPLLSPNKGFVAFGLFSHKIIRWFVPVILIAIIVINIFLSYLFFFQMTLICQFLIYLIAFLSYRFPYINKALKIFRFTTYFTITNAALLIGLFRSIRGIQTGTWEKAGRD